MMEPYITVASSGDNGYTWTDEYPIQKLDTAGIAAIAAHDPHCDSQRGVVRVYWGEGPGECDEYTLPLSKDDIDAMRLVVDGAVESFSPPVPAQTPNPPLKEARQLVSTWGKDPGHGYAKAILYAAEEIHCDEKWRHVHHALMHGAENEINWLTHSWNQDKEGLRASILRRLQELNGLLHDRP